MNQLIIMGNVGANAEVHKFENGRYAIKFSVAVNDYWTDTNGEKQVKTEWVRCVRYGKTDSIAKYITKGLKLSIIGRAAADAYVKEDKVFASLNCIVREIHFAEGNKSKEINAYEHGSDGHGGDSNALNEPDEDPRDGLPF